MNAQRILRRKSGRPKSRCPDCENAIFDDVWGEYKCKIRKIRINDPNKYSNCKDFKKKASQS